MCSKHVIHVFIGAPVIAPCTAYRASSGDCTAGWRRIPYAGSLQGASLQDGRCGQRSLPDERSGDQTNSRGAACDLGQEVGADGPGAITDLVSSTELCHITQDAESAGPGNTEEARDPDHPQSLERAGPGRIGEARDLDHSQSLERAGPGRTREVQDLDDPESASPGGTGGARDPNDPESAGSGGTREARDPNHPQILERAGPGSTGEAQDPDHLESANSGDTGEAQDPGFLSYSCTAVSAHTEFLSVLTSSQLTIKCPGNNGATTADHLALGAAEFVTQGTFWEDVTEGSTSQSGFTDSLDLFTVSSDEGPDDRFLRSQKSENVLLPSKADSSAERTYNKEHLGSTSTKRKEAISDSSTSSKHNPQSKKPKQSSSSLKCAVKSCDGRLPQTPALTLLKHCSEKSGDYNIMVVVLQPCHVKEIKVKSGPNVGSTLPLATIVVTDQSEVKHTVLMWRTAAFWSLALLPGEIIVLTHLSLCEDRWREDMVLQSSFRSKLVSLGSCSALLSGEGPGAPEDSALQGLLHHIQEKHQYLCELSPRRPQKPEDVRYASLAELQPELLLHAILKVKSISILKESTYHFKGLQQHKVLLTVEQVRDKSRTLVLWGASASWRDQIHLKRHHIWVFKYLFCKKNIISGDLELHTTPWSSCECLFDDDQRAIDFQKGYNISSTQQMSLLTMIEDRYSGEIQVKGRILQIEFHILGQRKILISHETSISGILKSLPDIIYTGCGKCQRELHIDDNNVYEQCYECLPSNQVNTFYRAAQITVLSDDCCICVRVPPDVVGIVFLNIAANLLPKVFPSCKDVTYGVIVADLCRSLLAPTAESFVFTIRSQFMLDENSVTLEEEFHLLDFHIDL